MVLITEVSPLWSSCCRAQRVGNQKRSPRGEASNQIDLGPHSWRLGVVEGSAVFIHFPYPASGGQPPEFSCHGLAAPVTGSPSHIRQRDLRATPLRCPRLCRALYPRCHAVKLCASGREAVPPRGDTLANLLALIFEHGRKHNLPTVFLKTFVFRAP